MKHLPPFQTELFFADYEFTSPHNLAASDCESVSVGELLQMAGTPTEALENLRLGYTESRGHPELRKKIAARYQGCSDDNVLVLGSPIEGLFLLSQCFTGETIVLTPAYDALKNLPQNIVHWSLDATENCWQLNLQTLDNLVTDQTELLVVNFPHNPTGFVPSPQEWEHLIQWARERDIWLFSDEMYFGLHAPTAPALPSAVEVYDKAIVLGGLSKSQGLPGLRCGWMASQDTEVLQKLHDLKLYTSMCAPASTEFLAMAALDAEQDLVKKNNSIIQSNLKLAESFFGDHTLFRWRPPLGGSICLLEIKDGRSAEEFAHKLAREHGVVLLPGAFLGLPDKYLRMGLGRKNFPKDLEALKRALKNV